MDIGLIVVAALVLLTVIILAKTAVVVPQQSQYVVERLGKYAATLDAGFHILAPFIDSIPLPPLAERVGPGHPGTNLHHE